MFGDGPFSDGTVSLTEAALADINAVPGVARAEGRPRSVAQLSPAGDDRASEAALAVAVPDDPDAAAIELRTGRLPQRAGEVAVDVAGAAAVDVATGDRVQVMLPDGQHAATVVGTVGFGRLDGLAGGTQVPFDAENRHAPVRQHRLRRDRRRRPRRRQRGCAPRTAGHRARR